MLWLLFNFLAYFLWTLTNLGDKYVVGNRITNPYVYAVVGFFASTIGLIVLPFVDFYIPSLTVLFWLFISSFAFFVGAFLYLKSMAGEDVSRVAILFNFLGVFSLIFAWIFIGEKLNINQFVAFILMLLGSIFASVHFHVGKFKISKVLIFMLLACACYAFYDVVNRYLVINQLASYSIIYIYLNIYIVIFCLLFFLSGKFRKVWKTNLKGVLNWKLILIVVLVGACSRFGSLFHTKAISLGPVALINAMEGLQSIMVFGLAILISYLAPQYIREETDKKNLLLKFLALVFMIAGIVVLNV